MHVAFPLFIEGLCLLPPPNLTGKRLHKEEKVYLVDMQAIEKNFFLSEKGLFGVSF